MISKLKEYLGDSKSYIYWLMGYTKPYIPSLLLIMFLSFAGSLASVGLAVIGKEMIDRASNGVSVFGTVGIYVLIIFLSLFISVIMSLVTVVVYEKFGFGIRKNVYDKILNTKWINVANYHTGDLMTRLTSDTGVVADGISNIIPSIIGLFIELIMTFCTLAYYDLRLALLSLLIAPVAALGSLLLGRKIGRLQKKVQESESKYRSFIQESLSNIMIVKTFGAEEYSSKKLTDYRDERLYWVLKKSRMSLVASTVLSLVFQLGYILAFTWGAMGILNGTITFGTMTVFLTLVNRVQSPIIGLAQSVPKLVSIAVSAKRIIEIQNLPREERIEENISTDEVGVKIDTISFGYTNELVLDDINLDISPGEFVAIVGESGIGKTTLVRLIMAFTNPSKGLIQFYNQKGDTEISNAKARDFISYVPQGNTLFSGSISENVRMGKLDASDKEVVEALKCASAYEFVMELPDGIDTIIGEKGHGISEGQAQRIAIARALLRKAPLLILDEATSSLDENTELAVLENIRKRRPLPTCIIITHRRSVLKYCDREIVIENKKFKNINS